MAENNLNNLFSFNPAEIFQPEVFENIKYQCFYFIESIDRGGAADYAKILERALEQNAAQSKGNRVMYEILVFWMLRLKIFGFECLDAQDKLDLFKNNTADILKNELDFKEAVLRYVDIFESGTAVKEETKNFINSLISSPELLGSNLESFKRNNFQPTISNWLKQYQYSINKRGVNINPAAFDIVSFINSDVNIKYLSPQELETLKRILELYNWLLSPIIYSQDEQLSQPTPYIQSQRLKLPEEVLQPAPKLPPVTPVPRNAPSLKRIDEINGQGQNQGDRINQTSVVNRTEQTNKRPSPLPQIRPGLSLGLPENYQMPKKENLAENVQAKIDKKLEDLEKRVK